MTAFICIIFILQEKLQDDTNFRSTFCRFVLINITRSRTNQVIKVKEEEWHLVLILFSMSAQMLGFFSYTLSIGFILSPFGLLMRIFNKQ